jgi:hypothetical protein
VSSSLTYAYCITKAKNFLPSLSFPSNDIGFGPPRMVSFEGIAAIVSDVPSSIFSEKELSKKMKEDAQWLAGAAMRHELAIESLMDNEELGSTPIPMKFCTIFKNDSRVVEMLSENYAKFRLILKKLEGKVELGVTAYASFEKIGLTRLVSRNPKIKKIKDRIERSTPGKSYFMKKDLELEISKESRKRIEDSTQLVARELKKGAVSFVSNEPLRLDTVQDPDLKEMKMVFNSAYLVQKKSVPLFKARYEKLQKRFSKSGLVLKLTGPWPPYNFV